MPKARRHAIYRLCEFNIGQRRIKTLRAFRKAEEPGPARIKAGPGTKKTFKGA